MAFKQFPRSENLTKLQVNFLRYPKKDLAQLRKSRRQELPIILDLFLLSDDQSCIYVLIKDLKISVSTLKQQVYDPVAKHAVSAFMFASQLIFTEDILRLACNTKQPLLNYQIKSKTNYKIKITSPSRSHLMVWILTLSRSTNLKQHDPTIFIEAQTNVQKDNNLVGFPWLLSSTSIQSLSFSFFFQIFQHHLNFLPISAGIWKETYLKPIEF